MSERENEYQHEPWQNIKRWHEHEVDFNRLSLQPLLQPLRFLVSSFISKLFACLLDCCTHNFILFMTDWSHEEKEPIYILYLTLARYLKYVIHFSSLSLSHTAIGLNENRTWGTEWESIRLLIPKIIVCILTFWARVRYAKHKTFWRAFIVHSIFTIRVVWKMMALFFLRRIKSKFIENKWNISMFSCENFQVLQIIFFQFSEYFQFSVLKIFCMWKKNSEQIIQPTQALCKCCSNHFVADGTHLFSTTSILNDIMQNGN